jgi:hypothetical protein
MNTRRASRQHPASSTISDSSQSNSVTLVTVEPSTPPQTHPRVANQDALIETRAQIVNPLWMVTGGLAILLALLAIFAATG